LAQALAYWRARGVDDPVPFALAEYYAGRGPVLRWEAPTAAEFQASITNPGVRRYIGRVVDYAGYYQARGKL
jgi:soluble lytic murein transglycosylase-like protein